MIVIIIGASYVVAKPTRTSAKSDFATLGAETDDRVSLSGMSLCGTPLPLVAAPLEALRPSAVALKWFEVMRVRLRGGA